MTRWRFLCAVLLAGLLAGAQAAEPPARPRIGLVLSGGGARGLAHVGVLRVLERERVPIDVIAGTSMGAIIGGLYASGMRAEDLERELLKIDWDALFANRVARRELSQRRKEQDYELSSALEIGLRDGEVRVPLGTVSSHGLESLLRRYTLPVRGVTSFDRLPIPFRAVATDMESGKAVVLEAGDLALALRSSMSVPGVFAPTEVDGRLLGDGGLVNNLPIDVARRMGADIVIAVNVGTPLAGRESLDTLVGVTAQMINILTEQNVQRSLATLTEQDLLITPPLGKLTAADFKHSADFIGLGRLHAEAVVLQMTRYAMDADTYSRWQAMHMRPPPAPPAVDFVRFEGVQLTHPERHAPTLESQPGKAFDADAAERDARRLAATGDYTRVDYTLSRGPEGLDGIVFSLEEKSWGPNYFRLGLTLNTDFNGRSAFNLTVAHNRRWLDALGSEWRNVMRIGSEPAWFTEWYQPLNWASALGRDWFLAPSAQIARSERITYVDPDGSESGRLRRTDMRLGVDLGRPWAELGEFRLGLYAQRLRDEPLLVRTGVVFDPDATDRRELGFRARAVIDQLDYVAFPQEGYRLVGEVAGGRLRSRREHGQNGFLRIEASGELATTWAETHTLNVFASTRLAGGTSSPGLGLYTLGGFQNLSGYEPGQVQGNYLVFGRVSYYHRLVPPALTRGFFAGASLESGNVWSRRDDASLGDLRYGGSLFLGADTGLGPLYLGVVYAPRGDAGVYLFLGRP